MPSLSFDLPKEPSSPPTTPLWAPYHQGPATDSDAHCLCHKGGPLGPNRGGPPSYPVNEEQCSPRPPPPPLLLAAAILADRWHTKFPFGPFSFLFPPPFPLLSSPNNFILGLYNKIQGNPHSTTPFAIPLDIASPSNQRNLALMTCWHSFQPSANDVFLF